MFRPVGSTSAACRGWQSPGWKNLHTLTVPTLPARPSCIQDRFARPTGCMFRAIEPLCGPLNQQRRCSGSKRPDDQLENSSQKPQSGPKKSPILSKIPIPTHENIYTVPNILTFSRLVAAPLVGYFLVHDHHTAALSLFVYAGLTDLVDGYIARRYNLQTVVGTIIDPMADKLLMTIGVACLAVNGSIPVWLAVIILGRDVGLALSAIYYRWISLPPPKTMARYWDFSLPSAEVKPTGISKVNTALQLVLVGSAIALPVIPEAFLDAWNLREGMTALQYLVAATTIWSGLSYVFSKDAVKILTKEEIQKRLARASGKK
ncbi:cardiolipin synthase [Aspergillus lentulus]|uniref:Cardiolipin synthase n=1 Tax=Aspergillus lentulus TaxID=293939 RepID=A0ABQ1ABI1_ASPLE|nr:cardiolipin synthase [Aspergillus lentulus]GFF35835.1 cardiolipin synthase [Aspergillus lentulus]GFF59793.1 cardiolipin synthase [Aspergillus lentulus]GFF78149.1 cardiolipin synthase [Aspergillus lentulus]GFG09331.1 cardiolipin synthase [Aspergillus lentulus]